MLAVRHDHAPALREICRQFTFFRSEMQFLSAIMTSTHQATGSPKGLPWYGAQACRIVAAWLALTWPLTPGLLGADDLNAQTKPVPDMINSPPGGVVVVVEDIKEALSLLPKMVLMSPVEYQKLLARLAILEKQAKGERKTAHVCKLTGGLEGDFVQLKAEFVFTTDEPRTRVALGLLGAYLTDEGELDQQVPLLEIGDDGLAVRVDKEGTHRLTLNIKVPVKFKRSSATAGSGERGFDLGLPGAAVTTLALNLPVGIKEIRWNDTQEKTSNSGRWELALGKVKMLNLAWKDAAALPGNAPLLTADSQVGVKIYENYVSLHADLTLEDLRGQTKEWRLLLPPNARVEVKTPAGLAFELLYPEGDRPQHIVRLAEASAERIVVSVQVRHLRPFAAPRLPIGPFFVEGAFRQEGTISIKAAPDSLRGQRLLFHRHGDIYPRDIPQEAGGTDLVALFKFWSLPATTGLAALTAAKAPLEVELKSEKILADVAVDHVLQFRPGPAAGVLELTTTIQLKSATDFLNIQLPRVPLPRLDVLALSVGTSFPAALPWLPLASPFGTASPLALPLGFVGNEEVAMVPAPDGQGNVRLTWNRPLAKEIKLVGKYLVPAGAQRVHVDLPRPVDIRDHGSKLRIKANEQFEIFIANAEKALPESKRDLQFSWDASPPGVDLIIKAVRAEFLVTGVSDVWLHERSAEVKQNLQFTVPTPNVRAEAPEANALRLRVPASVRELTVIAGGKLIQHDLAQEYAWIAPTGEPGSRAEIQLLYDFALTKNENAAPTGPGRIVDVPLVWPDKATHHDGKVRVWTEVGTRVSLWPGPSESDAWKDFGIEVVPGSDIMPALVLRGAGQDLPLSLRLFDTSLAGVPGFVSERALLQVAIDEEGMHAYRARYFVQKINARHLDFELPMPAANCLMNVWLDNQKITTWEPLETAPNIVQIFVQPRLYQQPVVLELEYKLPATFTDRISFWRTLLYAPNFARTRFRDAHAGKLRFPIRGSASYPQASWTITGGSLAGFLGPSQALPAAIWKPGSRAVNRETRPFP